MRPKKKNRERHIPREYLEDDGEKYIKMLEKKVEEKKDKTYYKYSSENAKTSAFSPAFPRAH